MSDWVPYPERIDPRKRPRTQGDVDDAVAAERVRTARVIEAARVVLWFLDQHLPTGGYHTFHAQVEELRDAIRLHDEKVNGHE